MPTVGYVMAKEIRRAYQRTDTTEKVRDHERRSMDRHQLAPFERETIIRTSDADTCWMVYSDSPAMIRQLQVLVKRVGGTEEPAQTTTGYRCVLPKAAVNALVARRRYGPLTDEERQDRVARLRSKPRSSAGRSDSEDAA
jgi:hypothetical protein